MKLHCMAVLAILGMATIAVSGKAQRVSTAPTSSIAAAIKPGNQDGSGDAAPGDPAAHEKHVSSRDQRRAAKLFMQATKLYQDAQFERAMEVYEQAAKLDPVNQDYDLAANVARSHLVTELIQSAAKDRMKGNGGAALAALQRAEKLDPENPQIEEHLQGLAGDASSRATPLYEEAANQLGAAPVLQPASGVKSFHLRSDRRQLIQTVFRAFGVEATVDQSVPAVQARFDMDDASFKQAAEALGLVTETFWVPLDEHRALVARDTRLNREQFLRQEMETVYLSGLTPTEMTDVGTLAKNVFDSPRAVVSPSAGTLTLRAPVRNLDAFNATLKDLLAGRSQVLLDVRLIQLAHSNQRDTGVQLPQQITAFNVYAEEQAILNANQALVQQIISSGLAAPGDTLAILGILLASGQVSNSIFTSGIALFGGGLTLSGVSPGPTTLNLNLNSSDSRELDQVEIRVEDGDDGTLKLGTRYPILTSSYSNQGASGINIPGLTSAGTSGSLSSLLSSLQGAATQIPQVQYQDLGLTLKATPKVMRDGDVALTLDLKITALAGSSVDGLPVLNNRSYSGVATVKAGAGVVLASEVSRTESQALSGTPGISEIPGMSSLTGNNTQKDYATLLIMITPRVIRGPQSSGSSPMFRIEKTSQQP